MSDGKEDKIKEQLNKLQETIEYQQRQIEYQQRQLESQQRNISKLEKDTYKEYICVFCNNRLCTCPAGN